MRYIKLFEGFSNRDRTDNVDGTMTTTKNNYESISRYVDKEDMCNILTDLLDEYQFLAFEIVSHRSNLFEIFFYDENWESENRIAGLDAKNNKLSELINDIRGRLNDMGLIATDAKFYNRYFSIEVFPPLLPPRRT